jgi:hypothetical protein
VIIVSYEPRLVCNLANHLFYRNYIRSYIIFSFGFFGDRVIGATGMVGTGLMLFLIILFSNEYLLRSDDSLSFDLDLSSSPIISLCLHATQFL